MTIRFLQALLRCLDGEQGGDQKGSPAVVRAREQAQRRSRPHPTGFYSEGCHKNRCIAEAIGAAKPPANSRSIPVRANDAEVLYQPRGQESPPARRKVLQRARDELRKQFGRQ
jgi:hypothetical protein